VLLRPPFNLEGGLAKMGKPLSLIFLLGVSIGGGVGPGGNFGSKIDEHKAKDLG